MPPGSDAVVIESAGHGGGVGALIVTLKFCVTFCGVEQLSIALMANVYVPALVGVPVTPDAPSVNPGGSDPDARLRVIAPCPPDVCICPPA